jgi:hypothetical protein
MDKLARVFIRYFSFDEVIDYLKIQGVSHFREKKDLEISYGFLFLIAISKNTRKLHELGLLITEETNIKYPQAGLKFLVENRLYIDEDIDMLLRPVDDLVNLPYGVQITQFKNTLWEGSASGLVRSLSENKFKRPDDPNLILLVPIDRDSKIDLPELTNKLKDTKVPYAQIFLMGVKKPEGTDCFFFWQVFPGLKILAELDYSFELEKSRGTNNFVHDL